MNLLHFVKAWEINLQAFESNKLQNLSCGLCTPDPQWGWFTTLSCSQAEFTMPATVECGFQTQQAVPLLVSKCPFLLYLTHVFISKIGPDHISVLSP